MLEEVDFTLEADNLEVFARFLEAEQLTDEATCPKVYRQASSKKVLLTIAGQLIVHATQMLVLYACALTTSCRL
jgi:predicted unusual protein kinase regulating ubiquinone biosynthesis (AarF/ABC1/UbiB family)